MPEMLTNLVSFFKRTVLYNQCVFNPRGKKKKNPSPMPIMEALFLANNP